MDYVLFARASKHLLCCNNKQPSACSWRHWHGGQRQKPSLRWLDNDGNIWIIGVRYLICFTFCIQFVGCDSLFTYIVKISREYVVYVRNIVPVANCACSTSNFIHTIRADLYQATKTYDIGQIPADYFSTIVEVHVEYMCRKLLN